MNLSSVSLLCATFLCGALNEAAWAAPLAIEADMTPKEQIKLDFADGSKHFVLMVRREGTRRGRACWRAPR